MANIQEKISTLFPQATFERTDILEVTIADEQWHDLAHALRHDAEMAFDFLVTIVGMDWKEQGLGCIYELISTARNERISV